MKNDEPILKVKLTFTEMLLGTLAGDPNIAAEFIMSKHPNRAQVDESEAHPATDEEIADDIQKATTFFSRDSGTESRCLWDYQVKGFFKEACLAMIESDAFKKGELKNFNLTKYMFKRTIDKQIFVTPRKLILTLPANAEFAYLERPLRADTMRGERICLARSEAAAVGTQLSCEIVSMNPRLYPFIRRWLDYGRLSGLGQWRNAGFGRFEWEEVE